MLSNIQILLPVFAIAVFAASLVYAAYTDFKEMRITNKTCLVGLAAYGFYALSLVFNGDAGSVLSGVWVAATVFLVTAFMNAKNALGGGDVKLLTVLGLWTGSQYFLDTFFIVALCGGLVAAVALARQRMMKSAPVGATPGGDSPLEQRPIPYGPGITIAGLFLSSELILNALAQY
jgi:prepilin peptidase CpaA